MTSGTFTSVPIEQIWVDRAKRQRKELTGIQELGWSLQTIGLLHPVIITRDYELKTGERRLTAAKSIGWTHINAQFTDELDPAQLQLIELEENVRRVDLTWQDQCLAIENYHKLRAELEPEWTLEKTSTALNLSKAELSRRRSVAQEIMAGNQRVIEAPKFSIAHGITSRNNQRQQASVLADVAAIAVGNAPPSKAIKVPPIINADFIEWQKSYTGPKFNFIHCDFPYGINTGEHASAAGPAYGGYDDSYEVYENLLTALARGMSNVVAESAHLMFWFSLDYYQSTFDALYEMGWDVNRFPLVWHKSNNVGILPDPKRGPRRIYETCFIASRGDRHIVRAISNVYSGPTTKTIHMSEKPVAMLRKFMEMFVDDNTVMLDPTCGSANALKAAEAQGAYSVLGIEKVSEFFNLAKEAYYNDDI